MQRDISGQVSSSFLPESSVISIPRDAYRPFKRCRYCSSVYITDVSCEACGKSLVYDPIGTPFGAKSYFALKERYLESWPEFNRFFPFLENTRSEEAKSFVRKLKKRLFDLLDYFSLGEHFYDEDSIHERKLFFTECKFLVDELLAYHVPVDALLAMIEKKSHGIILEELVAHASYQRKKIEEERKEIKRLRLSNLFLASALAVFFIFMAVKFYPN